jgi:hypothetical protein
MTSSEDYHAAKFLYLLHPDLTRIERGNLPQPDGPRKTGWRGHGGIHSSAFTLRENTVARETGETVTTMAVTCTQCQAALTDADQVLHDVTPRSTCRCCVWWSSGWNAAIGEGLLPTLGTKASPNMRYRRSQVTGNSSLSCSEARYRIGLSTHH